MPAGMRGELQGTLQRFRTTPALYRLIYRKLHLGSAGGLGKYRWRKLPFVTPTRWDGQIDQWRFFASPGIERPTKELDAAA